MAYLLDTHILLWAVSEPAKLSQKHKQIIENKANRILVSHFSYMELSIKLTLGKLPDFIMEWEDFVSSVEQTGIENLPVSLAHIRQYQNLPLFQKHRDPFDRFII